MTIRSMHAAGSGGLEASKKLKALMITFACAIIHRVASYYAIGILYDWHIFTWYVSHTELWTVIDDTAQVLYLGQLQEFCDSHRKLGMDYRVDSCFHW